MRLIVVGRDPEQASLVISNDYVSGYHAEIIQLDNGDMYIVDKSANGTYINGNRLTPGKEYPLKRGSQVAFADSILDWSRIPEIIVPSNVKKIISIGSHYMNTIKLDSPNVSRFHATIRQMDDGKWYICDHSLNGTTVNGMRIPKDTFVPLSSKDTIICADQRIDNPATKGKGGSNSGPIVGIIAACVCILLAVGAFFYFANRSFTNEQLCEKYERSVGLMVCSYHFEVKCGSLDLSELPDPDHQTRKLYSKFIVEDDKIFEFDGDNNIVYTGTGFFVDDDGLVVSNRHIACPWENSTTSEESGISAIEAAEEFFKAKLTKLYELGYTEALQYISQVSVSGELDNAVIIPNGDYLDADNAIPLHVEKISKDDNVDLALFKVRSSSIPAEVKYIKSKKIKSIEPTKGTKILTIGFPFGVYLLDGKTKIQSNFSDGSISRTDNKYKFGFTAPTFHGASGSPIFDSKGNVIGVVSAGMEITQGFNEAERASYLIDLLNE